MSFLGSFIPTFIKNWLTGPVVKAKLMKWLRWASQGAGTIVLSGVFNWLHANFTTLPDTSAATIAGVCSAGAAGLILSIGSAMYAMIDVDNVDAKVSIAAMTGSVSATGNVTLLKEVKAAQKSITAPSGSPEALQQLKDVLVTGQAA